MSKLTVIRINHISFDIFNICTKLLDKDVLLLKEFLLNIKKVIKEIITKLIPNNVELLLFMQY